MAGGDYEKIKQPWNLECEDENFQGVIQTAAANGEGPGYQQCPITATDPSVVGSCSTDFSDIDNKHIPSFGQNSVEMVVPSSPLQEKAEDDKNKPFEQFEVSETGKMKDGTETIFRDLDLTIFPAIKPEAESVDRMDVEVVGLPSSVPRGSYEMVDANPLSQADIAIETHKEVFEEVVSEGVSPQGHLNELVEKVRSIPGDGSTKVCLVGDFGGADCQLQISDKKSSFTAVRTSSPNLPDVRITSSDESTVLKHVCGERDPGSLEGALGEKTTSEDFMLCLRDPLTGSATCEPLCSSSSRSTLSRSSSGVCLCESPLLDTIVNKPTNSHDLDVMSSPRHSSQLSLGGSSHMDVLIPGSGWTDSAILKGFGEGLVVDKNVAQKTTNTMYEIVVDAEPAESLDVYEKIDPKQSSVKSRGAVAQEIRSSRADHVVSLDEYKRSRIDKKQGQQNLTGAPTSSIHVRHQNRDSGYNYADSSHGAKLVACNKEAKGAAHILVSDKDKYLRNPCSAEDKYVVVELSEETLVDNFMIANFEFHSSNVKELELLGSQDVFPTDEWLSLGKFEAENARHPQMFTLAEPKSVRCLKLRLISHYGNEFYCTLSVLEVHGVDAIERFLEDWIGEEGDSAMKGSLTSTMAQSDNDSFIVEGTEHVSTSQSLPIGTSSLTGDAANGICSSSLDASTTATSAHVEHIMALEVGSSGIKGKDEESKFLVVDAPQDVGSQHFQFVRSSGDSVMKILMQKVKSLELNQSLFDEYLENLNQKYKEMFNDLDQDLSSLTEKLKSEIALSSSLATRLHEMVRIVLVPF